jgi:hypothetical protein
MISRLQQQVYDLYKSGITSVLTDDGPGGPIQIDDQDELDNIEEFCTIFVQFHSKNHFTLEMRGNFPLTRDIADLVEIYNGSVGYNPARITLRLSPLQIDALLDLAGRIRKTAFMGKSVKNPNWHRVSARTISSLYRFIRIVKSYREQRSAELF